MLRGSCRSLARPCMSGGSAGASAASSRSGQSAICTTLVCPGAILFARRKSHFGGRDVVGEARYAFHSELENFEFGLSIHDGWHRQGVGTAMLANMQCRAAALGALTLFGDTLRSNDAMIALARKSGFAFARHPDDWKLVRFEKHVD